ncbi:MAG: hypothetical protein PHO37_12340 [Kiritimatiellae bacterium]|nr:hypothetical protein [Kiritimatiellia bacterium]
MKISATIYRLSAALLVLAPCIVAAQSVAELDVLLTNEALWQKNAAELRGELPEIGFQSVDGETIIKSQDEKLQFCGFKVWEVLLYFDSERISRVALSLYNKGDAGDMDQEAFKQEVEGLCGRFNELTGSRGVTGKVSNDRANYYVNRRSWVHGGIGIRAEWAFVAAHRSNRLAMPFRAEFIKVLLAPISTSALSGRPAARPDWASHVSGRTLLPNVRKNNEGDLWVEGVPMVDQGQKGYCAAASAERVLRYYGWQGDQHEIAQLADTAAVGGTSLEGMIGAVATVGKRYQLNDKSLIKADSSGSFEKSGFHEIIKAYNREAKSKKAVELDYMDFCDINPDSSRAINIMALFTAMDPDVLKSSRINQRQAYARFQEGVVNYVKQGVPLFWACIVGKYPETPDLGANGAFGHIRLIIGINQKTQEIIYSDSWGPRHALKRMPLDDAWAMTFGLTVLKPRDVR